jgi:hypothetical protein
MYGLTKSGKTLAIEINQLLFALYCFESKIQDQILNIQFCLSEFAPNMLRHRIFGIVDYNAIFICSKLCLLQNLSMFKAQDINQK